MINKNIKKVLWYLKSENSLVLIVVFILFLILFINFPKEEDKTLLELKFKVENTRKKIEEAEDDMKKYKSFHECYLGQIDRIIEWKKTLLDYCEKNFQPEWHKYYFTDYDLGDIYQNDASPCIWASGKNLCKLHQQGIKTIALVNIKRKELWINLWDKVTLLGWPCEWVYEVHDEMNIRFRQKKAIYKQGHEIRWDIARFNSKEKCSWVYEIIKNPL